MSAAGVRVPPFFVFPGKRWKDDLLDGASPESADTISETGWSNSEVFMDYLEKHFLLHVSTANHLLILFDGHKSHVNLTFADWGKKYHLLCPSIHVACHATLNIGCIGPLKNKYFCEGTWGATQACKKIGIKLQQSAVEVITRALQMKTSSPHSEKAGINPFDRTKITPFKQHRPKCTPLLNLKLLRNQRASSNSRWLYQLKKPQKC